MFKCECGCGNFYAHTAETMSILYDGSGNEVDGGEIMDVERPAWNKAYHCVKCDKAYRARRYLDKHGTVCPICECDDIVGHSFDSDGTNAWQSVSCNKCGAEWDDIYYLREVDIDNYPTGMVPKGILEPEKIDPNKEFKK